MCLDRRLWVKNPAESNILGLFMSVVEYCCDVTLVQGNDI